ncbi:MAG: U32 family peptidase [Muribaculaceae bacterium]|nr:U32 family peptidase [Muribaculaceae bacterium]
MSNRKSKIRELELLAPAANVAIAREAILHGADAVYIGASSHGARKSASNSVEDIAELVKFAHQYHAKVYVTVNTLVYDKEITNVKNLIRQLYLVGVDALIVQDMGVLRMDIPPIELHASTQCDTRDVDKARFLEKTGFSQIVLARELSLEEIQAICDAVTVPVECFIHGALCVSYSGRCRASQMETGRSANRGECSQLCRLPYTLTDADGKVLVKDKYLLSLRDFNASAQLAQLVEAGVSSFKIEGRLKDAGYVKNITAYYRALLDSIIAANPDKYKRSSYGKSEISFIPDPNKSFNRGFTSYFLEGRRQKPMTSFYTPKSFGEVIEDIRELKNGDGISFINEAGEYEGVRINRVENGRLIGAKPFRLPKNCQIYRTYNREWQNEMERDTAVRKIAVDIEINDNSVTASDERGVRVTIPLDTDKFEAQKVMDPMRTFAKLGNTIYILRNFENNLDPKIFIPASQLTEIRRKLIAELDRANETTYPYHYRRQEDKEYKYLKETLEAEDNVANRLAEEFYKEHGALTEWKAIEVSENPKDETEVMTTRYCLRRELGMCKKEKNGSKAYKDAREPFYIQSGPTRFRLQFDCASCEMRVISPNRK